MHRRHSGHVIFVMNISNTFTRSTSTFQRLVGPVLQSVDQADSEIRVRNRFKIGKRKRVKWRN
jgi:hypothetical protein